ncbi:MAG TPA: orotidine-5'-phosphate decarboxylase [Solirubrobacteraceae bacterium]|jgi:orotidine-5'-phosphate decarboxylase
MPASPPAGAYAGAPREAAAPVAFGDRLAEHVLLRQSQIVLGLDPDPMALWPATHSDHGGTVAERAAASVLNHCRALIDAAGPACVAVKPQLARFEVLGAPGWAALEAVVSHAHEASLLVIADAKRGDIDVSALAYSRALMGTLDTPFGPVAGLGADMLTVNPLMGADAIEPFVSTAREVGAGVLALVRTSNPGAADIEDLPVEGGGAVWERLASLVHRLGGDGVGESGLSDVGAVVGATAPHHLARARELMPHAVFLLPGVGAQGGRVEDLAPAFAPGRAGGLITASRSIANAHRAHDGDRDPATEARAEAERLRELAWQLT